MKIYCLYIYADHSTIVVETILVFFTVSFLTGSKRVKIKIFYISFQVFTPDSRLSMLLPA